MPTIKLKCVVVLLDQKCVVCEVWEVDVVWVAFKKKHLLLLSHSQSESTRRS